MGIKTAAAESNIQAEEFVWIDLRLFRESGNGRAGRQSVRR